jgi:uncharacterized membrane protein YphA (DoxX/SURF4 family)
MVNAYTINKPKPDTRTSQYGTSGWLFILLRVALGSMFVYASYDKILHPQAFSEAVVNYQILPDMLINLTALTLPWLELILGICLISGLLLPGATLLSSGLLTLFLGVLVFNQFRGLDIHCGCFSTEPTTSPAGIGTVLRDIGFLAVSLYLTVMVFLENDGETSSLEQNNDYEIISQKK